MRVWHARAQALREGAAFFLPEREVCHRDVEQIMKPLTQFHRRLIAFALITQ